MVSPSSFNLQPEFAAMRFIASRNSGVFALISRLRLMRCSGKANLPDLMPLTNKLSIKPTSSTLTDGVGLIESLLVSGIQSDRFAFPLHFIKRNLGVKAKTQELREAMKCIAANSGGRLKLDGDTIRFE